MYPTPGPTEACERSGVGLQRALALAARLGTAHYSGASYTVQLRRMSTSNVAVLCGLRLAVEGRTRFLLLCTGAIASAVAFAALQEGVWRIKGFAFSGYMTFVTAATMAGCGQLERVLTDDTKRLGALGSYLKLSLLTLSGMYFTNWSLKFLNYPTRVLFKSSKLVPTMVMGSVMQGRWYSLLEYVAALGLVLGILLFTLGDAV